MKASMKNLFSVAGLTVLVASLVVTLILAQTSQDIRSSAGGKQSYTVCHNENGTVTQLEVNKGQLKQHINHGDYPGPCPRVTATGTSTPTSYPYTPSPYPTQTPKPTSTNSPGPTPTPIRYTPTPYPSTPTPTPYITN